MNSRSGLVWHLIGLTALCSVLFFLPLGHYPFFNKGEPREALVVLDIASGGDWIFPLKYGQEIPSKPPLFHWFGAMVSLLRGQVTEATVRFPSAFFATMGVLLIYLLGRTMFDPETALIGGIVLATSLGYQTQAVTARVDMTLSFFITAALILFYLCYQGRVAAPAWYYLFYFFLGVGALAKGPVGLILPAMVIGAFLGWKKQWRFLSRLCFHPGMILTLVVALSWYGVALMMGGEEFFDRQILQENLSRFFAYGEAGTGHQKPIYYYVPYLFLQGLPWSLLLLFVAIDGIRDRSLSEDGPLFLTIWASVIFIFFSLSAGKRSVYILPLYPALALLVARWLQTARREGKWTTLGLRLAGVLCLVVFAVVGGLLVTLQGAGPGPLLSVLASVLKPKDQAAVAIVLAVIEQGSWLFFSSLWLSVFLWLFLGLDLVRLRVKRIPLQLSFLSLWVWLLAQGSFVPAMAEAKSYGYFMDKVNREVRDGPKLFLYPGNFDRSSLIFYRGGPIPVIENSPKILLKRMHSEGDYVIMSEADWESLRSVDGSLPRPRLKSNGRGPDGDAPLVLVGGQKLEGRGP